MNKLKLPDETKLLIQKYLIKRLIFITTAVSIVTFFIGFFIKDIAKAEAYNSAYSEAAQTILEITREASESAYKIKIFEEQFAKMTTQSEKVLNDANELKEKIRTTLVIQQSDDIVSGVTKNLQNDITFQNAINSKLSNRIMKLESKTKNMSIDESGNTVFQNDLITKGVIYGYNVAVMDKK